MESAKFRTPFDRDPPIKGGLMPAEKSKIIEGLLSQSIAGHRVPPASSRGDADRLVHCREMWTAQPAPSPLLSFSLQLQQFKLQPGKGLSALSTQEAPLVLETTPTPLAPGDAQHEAAAGGAQPERVDATCAPAARASAVGGLKPQLLPPL